MEHGIHFDIQYMRAGYYEYTTTWNYVHEGAIYEGSRSASFIPDMTTPQNLGLGYEGGVTDLRQGQTTGRLRGGLRSGGHQ
jgi:hypothetical protein